MSRAFRSIFRASIASRNLELGALADTRSPNVTRNVISSRHSSCFDCIPNSVGRSKVVAVARLPVDTSDRNVSGTPATMQHMSLYWRTSSGSPPSPELLNAASAVPGPLAHIDPLTAVGFWSYQEDCPVFTVV